MVVDIYFFYFVIFKLRVYNAKKKYYKIELPGNAEIHVYFETANGLIIDFVVKLVLKVGTTYYELIRFDSAHGCPHKDILDVNGKSKKKVWFELLNNKQGLDLAVRDLKDNHEIYIERFKKWQAYSVRLRVMCQQKRGTHSRFSCKNLDLYWQSLK